MAEERALNAAEGAELRAMREGSAPIDMSRLRDLWERALLWGDETATPNEFYGLAPRMNDLTRDSSLT